MSKAFSLGQERILKLHECLINVPTYNSEVNKMLKAGLPPDFRDGIPISAIPKDELMEILNIVNQASLLADGQLPLEIILRNIVYFLRPYKEEHKFALALKEEFLQNLLVAQLSELISRADIDESILADIYHYCRRSFLHNNIRFSYEKRDLYIKALFEGSIQGYSFGFPVCLFASAIGQTSTFILEMEEWIDNAIRKMEWRFDKNSVSSQASKMLQSIRENKSEATEYLQVKVTADDANNTHVAAEVYYWQQQNSTIVEEEGKTISTTWQNLPAELHELIANRALIELFLPTDLMNRNIEFEDSVTKKDRSLIVRNPVVRRFADRIKIAKITKETKATRSQKRPYKIWIERWQKYEQECTHVSKVFHPINLSKPDIPYSLSNIIIDLEDKQYVCCTAFDIFPDAHLTDLLRAHISSGVPIVFWPGKSLDPLELKLMAETHFCIPPESLLSKLHAFQIEYLKKSKKEIANENLYIIYDNPNRLFHQPGNTI